MVGEILEVLLGAVLLSLLYPTHSFGLSSERFPQSISMTSRGLHEVGGSHPGVFCISSDGGQEACGFI